VRSDVLDATTDLLSSVGYERMSIEDVAARAGVHKTTVYRRWTSKAELVADSVRLNAEQAVPIEDTGSLVGDLRALGRNVVANIGSEAGSMRSRSIVAASTSSDELTGELHLFWADRLARSEVIVQRAIDRGELPAGTEANVIIEAVVGPIWLRLLLTGEPIDADFADRIATFAAGAAAG
jgi:AcrR family transcriptional regulator